MRCERCGVLGVLWALGTGVVLAGGACGDGAVGDDPSGDLPGRDPGGDFRDEGSWRDTDEEQGGGTCRPAPFVGSLEGTWANVQQRQAVVNSAALEDVSRQYTSLSLWRVEGSGERPRVRSTSCHVEVESPDSPVVTTIPEALVRSIPVQELDCLFEAREGGIRMHQAPHVEVRGAILDDPEGDPLPTDAQDPRVVDQDRDGQPGVTVLLSGIVDGAVFVVQRIRIELDGCSTESGDFEGRVLWSEEQVVLGSDSPILLMQSVITPVLSESRFQMKRIPDGATCEDLQAHQNEWLHPQEGEMQ